MPRDSILSNKGIRKPLLETSLFVQLAFPITDSRQMELTKYNATIFETILLSQYIVFNFFVDKSSTCSRLRSNIQID